MTNPHVEVPDHSPSYQLELEDLTVGDGEEAVAGRVVDVHYVGVSWKTGARRDRNVELLVRDPRARRAAACPAAVARAAC